MLEERSELSTKWRISGDLFFRQKIGCCQLFAMLLNNTNTLINNTFKKSLFAKDNREFFQIYVWIWIYASSMCLNNK